MNRREFIKMVGALSLVPLSTKIRFVEKLNPTLPSVKKFWFIDGIKVESLGIMPRFHATEWDDEGNETDGNVFNADVYRLSKRVGNRTLESYSLIDELLINAVPSPKEFISMEINSHIVYMNRYRTQDN